MTNNKQGETARIDTTTRSGEKVQVRTGFDAYGTDKAIVADGRGYETVYQSKS